MKRAGDALSREDKASKVPRTESTPDDSLFDPSLEVSPVGLLQNIPENGHLSGILMMFWNKPNGYTISIRTLDDTDATDEDEDEDSQQVNSQKPPSVSYAFEIDLRGDFLFENFHPLISNKDVLNNDLIKISLRGAQIVPVRAKSTPGSLPLKIVFDGAVTMEFPPMPRRNTRIPLDLLKLWEEHYPDQQQHASAPPLAIPADELEPEPILLAATATAASLPRERSPAPAREPSPIPPALTHPRVPTPAPAVISVPSAPSSPAKAVPPSQSPQAGPSSPRPAPQPSARPSVEPKSRAPLQSRRQASVPAQPEQETKKTKKPRHVGAPPKETKAEKKAKKRAKEVAEVAKALEFAIGATEKGLQSNEASESAASTSKNVTANTHGPSVASASANTSKSPPPVPGANIRAGLTTSKSKYPPIGNLKDRSRANLIGVVVFAGELKKTSSEDWSRSFKLCDPSKFGLGEVATAVTFARQANPDWLPTAQVGQVLLLRDVSIKYSNNTPQATGYHGSLQWVCYNPATKRYFHSADETPKTKTSAFSPYVEPEPAEIEYFEKLGQWWTAVGRDSSSITTTQRPVEKELVDNGNGVFYNYSFGEAADTVALKQRCFSDLKILPGQSHVLLDVVVEVLHASRIFGMGRPSYIHVTDYTENDDFRSNHSIEFERPPGKRTCRIELWDDQSDIVEDMCLRDIYLLTNVKMKFGKDSYLEGKLSGSGKFVSKLDAGSPDEDRREELLKRKATCLGQSETQDEPIDVDRVDRPKAPLVSNGAGSSGSARPNMSNSIKQRCFSDIKIFPGQAHALLDVVVEVLHASRNFGMGRPSYIHVTDYTENDDFRSNHSIEFERPPGKRTCRIELWDDQSDIVGDICLGDIYLLKNVKMKLGKDSYLEGNLSGSGKFVSKLDVGSPDEDRREELLKRKAACLGDSETPDEPMDVDRPNAPLVSNGAESSGSARPNMSNSIKQRCLSDIKIPPGQAHVLLDAVVEVLHASRNFGMGRPSYIHVTDYTENDEFRSNHSVDFERPPGKRTCRIELWGGQSNIVEDMCLGDMYFLRNVKMKLGKDNYLEGKLSGSGKVVLKLDAGSPYEDRREELLKRKAACLGESESQDEPMDVDRPNVPPVSNAAGPSESARPNMRSSRTTSSTASHKRTLLRDVSIDGSNQYQKVAINAIVEILLVYPPVGGKSSSSMHITDYTPHDLLRDVRAGHEYYPPGKLTCRVDLWEAQNILARDGKIEKGIYLLKGIIMKLGRDGVLEGKMNSDEPAIIKMDEDPATDEDVIELLSRRSNSQGIASMYYPPPYVSAPVSALMQNSRHKNTLFQDVKLELNSPKLVIDATVEVLYLYDRPSGPADLHVTDYTANPNFLPSPHVQWRHPTGYRVCQIALWDDQKEMGKKLKIGGIYKLKGLTMKKGRDGLFQGNLGNKMRVMFEMKTEPPEDDDVAQLLKHRADYIASLTKESIPEPKPDPVSNELSTHVTVKFPYSNLKSTKIAEIKLSKECPDLFRIKARIIDFLPSDVRDFVRRKCMRCKRWIDDSKTKRCAPCALQSDGDDISCQYMFSLCVEDQNGDKLVLSVGDEDGCIFFSPTEPNDLYDDMPSRSNIKSRFSRVVGNIESKSGVIHPHGPWLDLAVKSWVLLDGKKAYGLTGCKLVG